LAVYMEESLTAVYAATVLNGLASGGIFAVIPVLSSFYLPDSRHYGSTNIGFIFIALAIGSISFALLFKLVEPEDTCKGTHCFKIIFGVCLIAGGVGTLFSLVLSYRLRSKKKSSTFILRQYSC
jgi:MFS family permease